MTNSVKEAQNKARFKRSSKWAPFKEEEIIDWLSDELYTWLINRYVDGTLSIYKLKRRRT